MKNKLSTFSNSLLAACLILGLTITACQPGTNDDQQSLLFISTFADSPEQGLALYSLNTDSLTVKTVQTLVGHPSPSYFQYHPSKKYFYLASTSPLNPGDEDGTLSSFSIDGGEEKIEFLNAVHSYGIGPCHVSLDQTGRFVFVSSYSSGSLSVYPVLEEGRVGDSIQFFQYSGSSVNEKRQMGPHAHSSLISPDNTILYVADLGTDKVMVYEFDEATGILHPAANPWISCPPGSGPRHMALHPELDILYVGEELTATVSVFSTSSIKDEGAVALQQVSALPADYEGGKSIADVHISPDGKFVYVSNRGHNSIAVFRTDPEDGSLTLTGHQSTFGDWPRSFSPSPDANFLLVANMRSDNITLFRRNAETGMLEETGTEILLAGPKCIKFYP